MRAALATYVETLPEPSRTQMKSQAETQVLLMNSAWMRWMLRYDPVPALRRTKIPVLALFGSHDLQVPAAQNLPPMRAALELAGNPATRVIELPELNHLFQAAATGAPAEYSLIEETIDPRALQAVGDWIAGRAGSR
jgi:pimeloyl-ACP methyl ester carboxylesterase